MPKWNNPEHIHLTYKQGLHPIQQQKEVFSSLTAAKQMLQEIGLRFQASGCRVKIYQQNGGLRAYDCGDEKWADRSFEISGCSAPECNTIGMDDAGWTPHDRQQYLQVLQERGLVP